jgi:hypothetical protein
MLAEGGLTPEGCAATTRALTAVQNLTYPGLSQNIGQLEGSYRDFQSNCWVNLLSLGHPCEFYLQLAASSCKPLALLYDRHADRSVRRSGAGRSFSALARPGFRFMETPDSRKVAPWAALAARRFAATLQASHGRRRHFLAGCPFSLGALCIA